MSALADALAAAQTRVVAALAKAYVRGSIEREQVVATLDGVGLGDKIDQEQLLAAWDAIREHGAQTPAEAKPRGEDNGATEAQWKLIRDLADRAGKTAPEGALTKVQASQIRYNPDDWGVAF
jgi:hypothetical protein